MPRGPGFRVDYGRGPSETGHQQSTADGSDNRVRLRGERGESKRKLSKTGMLHFNADFTRILVERVSDGRLDPILNVSEQASAVKSFKDELLACSDDYELREIGRRLKNMICDFRISWRLGVYVSVAGRGTEKGKWVWHPSRTAHPYYRKHPDAIKALVIETDARTKYPTHEQKKEALLTIEGLVLYEPPAQASYALAAEQKDELGTLTSLINFFFTCFVVLPRRRHQDTPETFCGVEHLGRGYAILRRQFWYTPGVQNQHNILMGGTYDILGNAEMTMHRTTPPVVDHGVGRDEYESKMGILVGVDTALRQLIQKEPVVVRGTDQDLQLWMARLSVATRVVVSAVEAIEELVGELFDPADHGDTYEYYDSSDSDSDSGDG
ncbi:hypothetical protein CYMTET_55694 [Cymbomonas tetramitiformis]|uniref:Uncharacterized protein n=1 Tax=Cymbomonas tetramitiformis TaxID=36881 RepID=A0AAE0BE56_9CHLO|nr:hypothetical protein CYMTET_55694 [Cymbomonas tetramitiformis]